MAEDLTSSDVIKIVLLGESGVGKTNLLNVAMGHEFEKNSNSSMSSSFLKGVYKLDDKEYTYFLWDTAGQESYRAINKIFIKNSKIVIFVYSIENYQSFKELDFWINVAKDELSDEPVFAIFGNKADLVDEQEVQDEEAQKFANEHEMKIKFTSALNDSKGVRRYFDELILDYIKKIDPENTGEVNSNNNDKKNIKISPLKNAKKKKKFC